MPRRPMSVCVEPTCPTLTRGTRCDEHQAEQYRADRQQRGSTTDRGLGWDHQRIAKRVLAAAKVCGICGQPPRPDDPLEADHIRPRSQGGRNVRSNYRAAHASCNRGRKLDAGDGNRSQPATLRGDAHDGDTLSQFDDDRDDEPPSPWVFA